MGNWSFDAIVNRENTGCRKWDGRKTVFGTDDVLPMWIADMDFQSPPAVIEALKKCAAHGVYGYPLHSETYYSAIMNWMEQRYGCPIEREWILDTPGVVPAINLAIQAFTRPCDKIIIQPPVYPPFYSTIVKNRRQVVENPLVVENGRYVMDFRDLEKKMQLGIKMLILASPHNPVGRIWTKDELQTLANLCLRHNVLILSDEIHGDFIFKGHRYIPMRSLSPEIARSTITCIAPSKSFNIAGLKTAVTIISNRKLRELFHDALEAIHIADGNIFGIAALEAAYRYGGEWLDDLQNYLEENSNFLTQFIKNNIPGIRMIKPEGTYLAWLDCQELGLTQPELRDFFVQKAKVGLNDGLAFGRQGEGFMRLNFGCPRETLRDGLERIEKAVKNM